MEREEPRLTSTDLSDVEFRPRGYRGPSRPDRHSGSDGLAWKIGVSVGIAVLAALLIFNTYERYQARKDAEQAMLALNKVFADAEIESGKTFKALSREYAQPVAPAIKPIPPGYRCTNGVLVHNEGTTWTQITARSRHMYCPGGGVDKCYYVTPRSVGCTP